MVYYFLEEIVGVKIQDFWKMIEKVQKPLLNISKMQMDTILQNFVFYTLHTRLGESTWFSEPRLYKPMRFRKSHRSKNTKS